MREPRVADADSEHARTCEKTAGNKTDSPLICSGSTAEFLILLYRSLIAFSLEFTLVTEENDL